MERLTERSCSSLQPFPRRWAAFVFGSPLPSSQQCHADAALPLHQHFSEVNGSKIPFSLETRSAPSSQCPRIKLAPSQQPWVTPPLLIKGPSTASPPQSTGGHRGAQPPGLAAQGGARLWRFVSGGAINKSVGGGGGDESEARRRESHFLKNELTKSGMPRCSGAK